MREKKKVWRWIAVLAVFGLVAAACAGTTEEPETTEAPAPATTQPEAPAATEAPPPQATGFTYTIGMIDDSTTDNYWNYLGPGATVYTQYVLGQSVSGLYGTTAPSFSITPNLATVDIESGSASGDGWVIEVPLRQDATWSSGEPITANDVVFTFNTAADFRLGGNWLSQWITASDTTTGVTSVEAVDDYTVKINFNGQPGLGTWHYAVAQAPILSEAFWAPHAEEAKAAGEAAKAGVSDPAQSTFDAQKAAAEEAGEEFTKTVDDITQDEVDAHLDGVFTAAASETLYAASGVGAPSAGAFVFAEREPGAFWRNVSVTDFYDSGATYKVYDSGAVTITDPAGVELTVQGEPSGNILAEYTVGPYAAEQLFRIYGTQDAAALALVEGEIDYWIQPLALSRGLVGQLLEEPSLEIVSNPSNGVFYFAFNVRQFPGNNLAYRQAVACMTNKEFISENVLGGQVISIDSMIPPGNVFWANPNPTPPPCAGMSEGDRLAEAVSILKAGGWSWTTEPSGEGGREFFVSGEGLTGPGGETLPAMKLIAPGPGYDPFRATYAASIGNLMQVLGIPIVAEPTAFSTIVNIILSTDDWDAYILGWTLGSLYPDYMESFFSSRNETVEFGGFNTPGYSNPTYDALAQDLLDATDTLEAQQIAWQLDEMIATDLPYIVLYANILTDAYSNKLQFPFTQTLDGLQNLFGVPELVTTS